MSLQKQEEYTEVIEQKIMKINGEVGYKRYGKGKLLGKGGFAKCYQGINLEDKKLVAIKVVQKSTLTRNRAKQKLLSQIKIHKTLHHKHIVQFDSVFEDSVNVYMILQLCTNKTLSEMVRKRKKLTPQQTRYFIIQLLSALQHLHQCKVIHRDLKMGNIFLNQTMDIKVGDFGLAAKLQYIQEKKRTMCGTPNYIAPEIVQGLSGHSYQVDVWSTGVICYALLFGRPPFQTNQVKTTYKKIKNCQYNFPNQEVPNSAKHFIKSVLILDPKQRLTIKQMLQHPFLNTTDIPKYLTIDALTNVPNFQLQQQIPLAMLEVNKDKSSQKSLKHSLSGKNFQSLTKRATDPGQLNKRQSQNLAMNTQRQKQFEARQSLRSPRSFLKEDLSKKQLFTNCQSKQLMMNDHKINIIAFVDYSTKYGLGYLINNKTYGVYFNDSSLMSIDGQKRTISYIQNPSNKQQNIQVYPYAWKKNNTLPNDKNFQKKFMLLQKFIVYLNDQVSKVNFNQSNYQKYQQFIYVKQWLKTKHAIMFRLSNRLFQVNFLITVKYYQTLNRRQFYSQAKKEQKHIKAYLALCKPKIVRCLGELSTQSKYQILQKKGKMRPLEFQVGIYFLYLMNLIFFIFSILQSQF